MGSYVIYSLKKDFSSLFESILCDILDLVLYQFVAIGRFGLECTPDMRKRYLRASRPIQIKYHFFFIIELRLKVNATDHRTCGNNTANLRTASSSCNFRQFSYRLLFCIYAYGNLCEYIMEISTGIGIK